MEISEETNSSITTYDTSVADNTSSHQVISSQPCNDISDQNCTDRECGIVFNKSPENVLKDILVWPHPKNTKKKRVQTERLPSVLTSEKWLEVMKAKEEEKQRRLEKKEEEKGLNCRKEKKQNKLN